MNFHTYYKHFLHFCFSLYTIQGDLHHIFHNTVLWLTSLHSSTPAFFLLILPHNMIQHLNFHVIPTPTYFTPLLRCYLSTPALTLPNYSHDNTISHFNLLIFHSIQPTNSIITYHNIPSTYLHSN